jgi:hypothetical protein
MTDAPVHLEPHVPSFVPALNGVIRRLLGAGMPMGPALALWFAPLIAAMAYDVRKLGRVHGVYWVGLAALALSLLRLPFRTTDLWLGVANKELLEMHRSAAFLQIQRDMTRSSTEYRLAEREIAEAFCEVHHIPTRTEMDEMQRLVTELKREVRALKKPAASKPPPAKRVAKPRKRK